MIFISIEDYGKTTKTVKTVKVNLPGLEIYFSYTEPVAFRKNNKLTVSENIWSQTTGRHLNIIDKKRQQRLKRCEFIDELKSALSEVLKK